VRRFAIAFALAGAICGLLASQALAYNNYDNECWWWNPSGQYLYVNWKWGPNINTSGGWATDFSSGSSAWSNAGSKVRMNYNSSAVDTADTYYTVESRPGYTQYWCNWWNYTMADAHAYGNLYQYSDSGTSSYRRATAAHEQGHTLGLGHSSDSGAVMYKFVNYGIYYPNYDDQSGLNSMYPW
jgi:hypothetical protein